MALLEPGRVAKAIEDVNKDLAEQGKTLVDLANEERAKHDEAIDARNADPKYLALFDDK